MGRTYDSFSHRCATPVTVPRTTGTCTALAVLAGSGIAVPFAAKLVAATMFHTTSATVAAASHTIAIVKSAAGTGTVTQVGTYTVAGTTATGEIDTATLAETNFAAGDLIGISLPLATTAVLGTANHCFVFEELPS